MRYLGSCHHCPCQCGVVSAKGLHNIEYKGVYNLFRKLFWYFRNKNNLF